MGIPTLIWSTGVTDKVLYNNAVATDSGVDNYNKARTYGTHTYTENEESVTETATIYVNNPSGNGMVVIVGGVYEKCEFITSSIGGSAKPAGGNPAYQNNVVFIDSGSGGASGNIAGSGSWNSGTLSYGPILAYSDGNSLGSNIEANVGWVASTINSTAGFHTNHGVTTGGDSGTAGRSTSGHYGVPYAAGGVSWSGTGDDISGTAPVTFPGKTNIGGSNIVANWYILVYHHRDEESEQDIYKWCTFSGTSSSKRVEMWAPGLTPTGTAQPLKGRVQFEIAKDKMFAIEPLDPLTVTGTASIAPDGSTHATATVTTSGNHNLADANNRIYVSGCSQVQLNGWHMVSSVTNATVFTYRVPLSLSSNDGSVSVSGTFTIETYDGIDKPGGVLKDQVSIDYIDDVKEYSYDYRWHANGNMYVVYSNNFYYRYHLTALHGFTGGDAFTVGGTSSWSGDKTVDRYTSRLIDYNYQSGTSSGTSSTSRLYTGSASMSGSINATIRAGGNAGNDKVIVSYDSSIVTSAKDQYQFYPNSSYGNVVYNVTCKGSLDTQTDHSLFTLAGLKINADTGVLSSNGAYDGVNNKGVRSLDSFYPKFLDARTKALNKTVTTGTITQSNTSVVLNNIERLPTGYFKTLHYANNLKANIIKTLSFTFEYANGESYSRAGVQVDNDIGDTTISEGGYTLTYVDNKFPVANSSAFFSIQKQNNTPMISGTDIIAFVGPDEGFHIPIWGTIKAYKNTSDFGSSHAYDSSDYAYQDFCVKIYKNLNADRDDMLSVYSDPKNNEQPVNEDTAFSYVSESVVTGYHGEDILDDDGGVVVAAGTEITDDTEVPITNSQQLANSYANGHFTSF